LWKSFVLKYMKICNQKRRIQKTRRIDAISHGPWFSHSINPPQIHRHLTFPDLDYLLAIAHRSTCNLKTDKPSNTSPDTTHSGHTLHTDASEGKILRHHSWIVYIVWERKHCPQTQFLTKTGGADCPSNSSSLSLSMSSYSNELDHTSDAAETHNLGQDSLLPSYSLFSLLPHSLLFSSPKTKTSLLPITPPPLSLSLPCTIFTAPPKTDFWSFFRVLRWLPPEASSNFPTPFHSPRSVFSLVTFIIW